eukprot:Tamp_33788.p2 GENE.Tamp_33788~~Tamp_33788.p2  ORF type:complete len:194 (-),score=30.93 Tamp_33788:41-538(-)
MPAHAGVALASRFDAKLSRSLQQLDHRLTQSAWRLSTPQLGSAAARGSAVARQQGGRKRLAARHAWPAMQEVSDVISRDATKFARQERQQQRAYNAVVAREEAQNEQYTEDEARYRKIRAHAYLQQYQGFIRRRRHEEIFGEGGRAARHHGLPGAAGGPGQHYYH